MVKFNYDKLSYAFQDYNGFYENDLKRLPNEVWDALDDYFDGVEVHANSLSELFDNLYINDLYVDDANEVDEDDCTVLYVDDNNVAYCLY